MSTSKTPLELVREAQAKLISAGSHRAENPGETDQDAINRHYEAIGGTKFLLSLLEEVLTPAPISKPLTKMQVQKLLKTNLTGESLVDCVLTGAGTKWELEVSTEVTQEAVQKLLPGVGGYTTGYGSLILKPGYQDKGDFNAKHSAWHN